MRFDTFDNINFIERTLMLSFCGLVCCYGFVTNNDLMLFASKVGFPIAIAAGAMANNIKKLLWIVYYAVLLICVGTIYFRITGNTINPVVVQRYVPTITDGLLAIGVGMALTYFWEHALKLNVIVMVAGLAFLLPSAIMAGYLILNNQIAMSISSLGLYFEYIFGIYLGSLIIRKIK